MLRICHVTNYLPGLHEHAGGAETACLSLANLLTENGQESFFLTTSGEDQNQAANCQLSTANCFSIPTIESYLPMKVRRYMEVLKWYLIQFDPISYKPTYDIFKKQKPHVVHFHNFQFLSFSALVAAKVLKIPACLSVYDYWYFCPLTTLSNFDGICRKFHGTQCLPCLPPKFKGFQQLLLLWRKFLFGFFLKRIDRFIVLSNSSAQILKDYGIHPSRVAVIPLPLSKDRFYPLHPCPPPRGGRVREGVENIILFAGWIQWRKGLHVVLQAMPQIIKAVPSAKLVIVGGDVKFGEDYKRKIMNTVKELDLEKHISLVGRLTDQELVSYLQMARVVVIPEQWENMSPMILLEAMALGKSIVASRIGGIPEFIEDEIHGLLADPKDPMDFANKVVEIMKNRIKAQQMGQNARQQIMRICDKTQVVSRLLNVYYELLLS